MTAIVPTWSAREQMRYKDFSEMSSEELALAKRVLERLPRSLDFRRTRRLRPGRGSRIDLRRALRHNLRFTIEHGVTTGNGSLLVGGAAGEHPLLSVDERKAVMEAAVDAVQGDAPVITSIQHTDARTVADMARHAARVGISAVQVSPAYYYPATEGDVLRLFHRVAAAADVSIMAYNTWWLGF